jgi:S1-C subfamily serine protease
MTVAEVLAVGLGERTAVVVTSVASDGRAAATGLRSGDPILALNDQELREAAELQEGLMALPHAAPLTLRVWRDRTAIDVVLTRMAP